MMTGLRNYSASHSWSVYNPMNNYVHLQHESQYDENWHHRHKDGSQSSTDSNLNVLQQSSDQNIYNESMIYNLCDNPSIAPIIQPSQGALELLKRINENIIGKHTRLSGPFGPREIIYADHTASGQPLRFIENYIQKCVLPTYGNVHSENTICSLQTTKFREEARELIKASVNANKNDVLIFVGTGSTGAVHKLLSVLQLKYENFQTNTVVFISAFEHHSNILPWREAGVEVIRIPNNNEGLLDSSYLEDCLVKYYVLHKRIICSFNAASNLTGIRTDVDKISKLVHQYYGFIFWDYASAAPYVKIDMNTGGYAFKDGIFISPHKFIGGPGTPGILIAKKCLFNNEIPSNSGGGTVNFVTRKNVEYIQDIERREEGGTPDIIGSIRAGLVFQLKDKIGAQFIEKREEELVQRFFTYFSNTKSMVILGSQNVPRLAIFSFLINVPMIKKYLHSNFVSALLNDLFGIQVRSGCACAGPYFLDLMETDDMTAEIYTRFISDHEKVRNDGATNKMEKTLLMKPGSVRVNLPYFADDEEINFILKALKFVAEHGWKLLPSYKYSTTSGLWNHRYTKHQNNLYSLKNIDFNERHLMPPEILSCPPASTDEGMDIFAKAQSIADDMEKLMAYLDLDPELNIDEEYKKYIWFATPNDIIKMKLNMYS